MPKSDKKSVRVPKFVRILVKILQDQQYSNQIKWLPTQNGFQIIDASRFIEKVLPSYFKHNNMASFVRQLNMYGFNRPKGSDQHIYIHPKFTKGNLNSMRHIQRKSPEEKTVQNIQIQSQNDSSEEQQVQNKQLAVFCKQLIEQNNKLKSQNENLNQQLALLLKREQAEHRPQLSDSTSTNGKGSFFPNICESPMSNQLKESVSLFQIHSFSFGNNNKNPNKKLSYESLLNGSNLN